LNKKNILQTYGIASLYFTRARVERERVAASLRLKDPTKLFPINYGFISRIFFSKHSTTFLTIYIFFFLKATDKFRQMAPEGGAFMP